MNNIYETTTKFTKYVKFLSNQFNISVEFDQPGLKRKENTIYLPSLYSLSQNELDILWGVLLQEAGFLKHSDLTKEENLLKIKTQNQLHLIKTLESVKVEKQLLSQYDGAQQMLSQIYEKTVTDNQLKEKFFPNSKSNVWSGICYWLHETMMGRDDTLIGQNLYNLVSNKATVKKVYKFIDDAGIKSIIKKQEITKNTSTEDVIKIANKIHNIFFASHDPSERLNYEEKIKSKKLLEELSDRTKQRLAVLEKEMKINEEKLNELKQIYKNEKQKVDAQLGVANQQKRQTEQKYNDLKNYSNYSSAQEKIKNSQKYHEGSIENNKEKIKNNKEQIENIKKRLSTENHNDLSIAEKNKDILEQLGFAQEDNVSLNELEQKAEQIQEQLNELTQNVKDIQEYQNVKEQLDKVQSKLQKQEQSVEQYEKKEQTLKEKEKSLQEKVQNSLTQSEKELFEEKLKENINKQNQNNINHQEAKEKVEQFMQQKEQLQQMLDDNDFKNDLNEESEALSEKVQENKMKAQQSKEQLNALNNELAQHNLTDEQREKLENKQKKLEDKNEELESKIKSKQETLEKLEKEVDALNDKYDNVKDEFSSLTEAELSEQLKNAQEEFQDAVKEVENLKKPLNEINAKIEGQKKDNENKENSVKTEIIQQMQELDPVLQDLGVDLGIAPKFIEMEGWDEANEVQKDFDKMQSQKTQQIVTNGAGFNFKGYDTLIEVTNKLETLQEINVQELFKGIIKTNPLESMAQEQEKGVLQDFDNYEFSKGVRAHVAATKEFDIVEQKNKLSSIDKVKKFAEIKQKLAPEIREIKNAMKNKFKFSKKPFYKGGKEEGDIDSRNIYRLATKMDNDYFEINNPKFINKIAATIVIDMSGSINKEYTQEGLKSLQTALLLSEGFKEVHIPHEIVAYGAEFCEEMSATQYSDFYNRRIHRLKTQVLKTFEDKDNNGLANFELQPIDNCDGESITIAYNRVKKRIEKQKMVFVISDGKPFLNDADISVLDEDLRKIVRTITEEKNHIFAIGFNDGPEQLYANRYKNVQQWSDLFNMIKSINLEGKIANVKTPSLK